MSFVSEIISLEIQSIFIREYLSKVSKYDRNTISNCYGVSVFSLSVQFLGMGEPIRRFPDLVVLCLYTPLLWRNFEFIGES